MSSMDRSHSRASKEILKRLAHDYGEEFALECESVYLLYCGSLDHNVISEQKLLSMLHESGRNPTQKALHSAWTSVKSLGFEEYCSICSEIKPTTREDMMNSFKKIDLNKDGFISSNELIKMITSKGEKMSKEEARVLISEADKNGDGKLDFEEFTSMMLGTAESCLSNAKKQKMKKDKQKNHHRHQPRPIPRKTGSLFGSDSPTSIRSNDALSPRSPRSKSGKTIISVEQPKNLSRWKKYQSKGCFYLYDDGSILGHTYSLQISEPTDVFLEIQPYYLKSQDSRFIDRPVDITIFILSDDDYRKSSPTFDNIQNRLITFSENVVNGKSLLRASLNKKGSYRIIPATTGCRFSRISEPSEDQFVSLIKRDKHGEVVLTKSCKNTLKDIFEMFDLDSNGFLSREEFQFFCKLTEEKEEELTSDDWSAISGLINNEMPLELFIDLNRDEAEGEVEKGEEAEDLWISIRSVGFNGSLILDEASPFSLSIYVENIMDQHAFFTVDDIEPHLPLTDSCFCEMARRKCHKTEKIANSHSHNDDVTSYIYQNELIGIVAIKNNCHSMTRKISVKLDINSCKNFESNRGRDNVCIIEDIPSKTMKIGYYLHRKNEQRPFVVDCNVSMI